MKIDSEKFRILVLSRGYSSENSSGVSKDFVNALKRLRNVEVQVLVRNKGGWDDPDVKNFVSPYRKLYERLIKRNRVTMMLAKVLGKFNIDLCRLDSTDPRYALQVYDETKEIYSTKYILRKIRSKPDAIFVLMMHGTFLFKNIYEIHKQSKAPVFLKPWDENFMTGGCHYTWGCERYQDSCGKCPAYASGRDDDQSRVNFLFKKRYIDQTNITLLHTTLKTALAVEQSPIWRHKRKFKLPLPINENLFSPGDRGKARKAFGLPESAKVIFFGAVSVSAPRKGFAELRETLRILGESCVVAPDSQRPHLLVAGNLRGHAMNDLPFPVVATGLLSYPELVEAFRASNVFVSPTIQDGGPMMVNQAMLCGTPVVSFEIGVAMDLVINGETGYRVPVKQAREMADALATVLGLDENSWQQMSNRCRNLGMSTNATSAVTTKIAELLERDCCRNLEHDLISK